MFANFKSKKEKFLCSLLILYGSWFALFFAVKRKTKKDEQKGGQNEKENRQNSDKMHCLHTSPRKYAMRVTGGHFTSDKEDCCIHRMDENVLHKFRKTRRIFMLLEFCKTFFKKQQ